MGTVGRVNADIYFGTLYDYINVPYTKGQIRTDATKKISVTGTFVWQSTWLNELRVNVKDYQDIVGAQWVEILEGTEGAEDHGSHFYYVTGYTQLSRKTVMLHLLYDALVSLNIYHITGISGVINRWTVNDDSQYKYIMTPEPVNQTQPYTYNYFKYQCMNEHTPYMIVGFPYDMTEQPYIEVYDNSVSSANIYYPSIKAATTHFTWFYIEDNTPLYKSFMDGMQYCIWDTSSDIIKNFNYATGLGYDITSNAYLLPKASFISIEKYPDGNYTDIIQWIKTNPVTRDSGLSLVDSGYRNSKAGEIGIYFTLFNSVTGDAVTVQNYDIKKTGTVSFTCYCDPYINGCFMARIDKYMGDNNLTGVVKSAGYSPFTISGQMAAGSTVTQIQTQNAIDSLYLSTAHQLAQLTTSNVETIGTGVGNLVGGLASSIADVATLDLGGGISNAASITTGAISTGTQIWSNELTRQYLESNLVAQKAYLQQVGNIGQFAPPAVKYVQSQTKLHDCYSFYLQKSTLSAQDRKRLDNFFTQYGYNVDKAVLNNPAQLACREKFTFIQAEEVLISSVSGSTDLTRLKDPQTVQQIKERFSAGLRIWKTTPNYDYNSISNPIV